MSGATDLVVPFSGVDSVMRALDEPDRPQTIELEVALAGSLDEPRLRRAVAEAAARHPMARARQRPAAPFDLGYSWRLDADLPRDPVEVRTVSGQADLDAARDRFSSRHLDVEQGPPFRVLLIHEPDGDRVLLSVNHTAFDGVATLRLLQSVSRAYAGEPDELPTVDLREARRLVEVGRRRPAPRLVPPRDVVRRPARLAAGSPTGPGFRILHVDLDAADAGAPAGATVNDVLLVALHQTIDRWNRSRGAPCGQVAVMMPVNERPAAWRNEVVANLVVSATVRSSRAQRATAEGLLAAVSAQTRRIKANGVEAGPTDSMPRYLPVALRRMVPRLIDSVSGQAADTGVLSNLGRVEDPPWFGAQGRGLWFSPPPRSPVVLTVGAGTAAGRLGLSFRWCAGALAPDDVRRIADLFVAAIGEVSASRG